MQIGKYKPSQIRKAIVAGAGAVAELGSQVLATFGVLPPKVHAAITGVVSVATVIGVFLVRNQKLIDAADNL